jgi:hypothetical protein
VAERAFANQPHNHARIVTPWNFAIPKGAIQLLLICSAN